MFTLLSSHAVPGSAVDAASAAYQNARLSKAMRPPLRLVSRGRLLTRNYVPGSDPGINDSIVAQQGPNYLLAKRIQRWRATLARAEGASVSLAVAPPTRSCRSPPCAACTRGRGLAAPWSSRACFRCPAAAGSRGAAPGLAGGKAALRPFALGLAQAIVAVRPVGTAPTLRGTNGRTLVHPTHPPRPNGRHWAGPSSMRTCAIVSDVPRSRTLQVPFRPLLMCR